MKYIRTKNDIISTKDLINLETEDSRFKDKNIYRDKNGVLYEALKPANTREELCDEFMVMLNGRCIEMFDNYEKLKNSDWYRSDIDIRGAIYTDEGLIYIAKIKVKEV